MAEASYWLLVGEGTQNRLGAMILDIVITSAWGRRRLILDAKYKLTTPGPDRPEGILREDLYQMASYLSIAANPNASLDGGLIYPASSAVRALNERGPFKLERSNARFTFYGVDCSEESGATNLSRAEEELVSAVQASLI